MYSTYPLIRTGKGQTFFFELTNARINRNWGKIEYLRNTKEMSFSLFKTFISYLKSP